MRRRWGTEPPEDDVSIGARMLRLRDPETGEALPDERLLPHIGMICESMLIAHCTLAVSDVTAERPGVVHLTCRPLTSHVHRWGN